MPRAFRRILIVEPNREEAERLRSMLVEEGHSLHVTETGESALERLKTDRPDLVLLSLVLPDVGGFEICRRIRGMPVEYVPIVMLGHGRNLKSLARGLNEGADDFVHKPYEPEELLARINVVFRWKARQEFLEQQAGMLQDYARKYQEQTQKLLTLAKELERQKIEDEVTGLHGAAYFQHRVNEEVSKIGRYGGVLSCVLLSIDNYEEITEHMTAQREEEFLGKIGETLNSQLRRSDVPTRAGKTQFAMLLLETNKDEAARLSGRIRQQLVEMTLGFPEIGENCPLKLFFGVASYPTDAENAPDLGAKAELALKRAHLQGSNMIYVYPT
jgi:diguanylate cyclase (GGDEF)-like protein